MALTVPIILAALNSARLAGGFPFAGINFDRLALAVALSLNQWGLSQPQNLAVAGLASGSLGSGAVAGQLNVPATVPVMQAGLLGAGMAGPLTPSLATVMTLGISQAFSTSGQYTGVAGTVGTGTDVSKIVVANTGTLLALLQANMAAELGPGPASPMMATGLANGITALLLLGTGFGTVVGTPTGGPGTGPTTSVVV